MSNGILSLLQSHFSFFYEEKNNFFQRPPLLMITKHHQDDNTALFTDWLIRRETFGSIWPPQTSFPYAQGYNFHSDHPEKFSVSELWVIFWGSPQFLAISGHSHFAIISTLNFGPSSTWWDCRDHQKNDPQWQRTWSWPELRNNGRFYVRPKSVFLARNAFYPIKSPEIS